MNKPLVTVVVPIYNTEKYLDRCVNSLVNQTYQNIDILLINDGSTDSCLELCESWAKKDTRVRVIDKQNEGLGITRNVGVKNAKGSYICFCDSDDYIDINMVKETLETAESTGAQLVVYGISTVTKNGEIKQSFIPDATIKTFKDDKVLNEFFPEYIAPNPLGDGKRLYYMSPCLLLYSTDMLRSCNWSFVSEREIISEDVYSLLALFKHVNSVTVVPKALYFYCENENSLSRTYREDRYKKIRHFYLECVKLCEQLEYNDDIMHRITKPYLDFVIALLKQELKFNKNAVARYQNLKDVINDDVLQTVLQKNKNDKVKMSKKILFYAMRKKWYFLCVVIFRIKG